MTRALRRLAAVLSLDAVCVSTARAFAMPMPGRIVSLTPSVTETLFAIGAGTRVVAVSDYCDYPPEATKLPKIGSFLSPSVEVIVGMRPDVVIGTPSPANHEAVEALRRIGIRVVIVDAERFGEMWPSIRTIADAAGSRDAGEALVVRMQREMDAIRARVADAPRRRALMVVGQNPVVAVGRESFLGDVLEAANAANVAPAAGPWPRVSLEYVIAADPEVVIDASAGMGNEGRGSVADWWAQYPSLAAVRERRVYAFQSFRMLRPGPRLPAVLEDLARLIHPERWR
jgi:iron complex transport system substrate-binding protein